MLKIFRVIAVVICAMGISLFGTLYALCRFGNPNNVSVVAKMFGALHRLVGLKVILRPKPDFDQPAIYIANHQNNYDMVTIAAMVPPRTVSIGKKSLIWIPFFGLVYWATGNILINRENRTSAIGTMTKVGEIINARQISVWMFPEGTRSRGRGLLPFKTGAFHTAISAGVPIVPIVCSTLHNKVDLNRADNGYVICETLEPIETRGYHRDNFRELIELCHSRMQAQIAELDHEVAQLESQNRA